VGTVVLSVVKSPFIDEDTLRSARCPSILSSVAIQHFVGLMKDFRVLTGFESTDMDVDDISEDDMKDSIK